MHSSCTHLFRPHKNTGIKETKRPYSISQEKQNKKTSEKDNKKRIRTPKERSQRPQKRPRKRPWKHSPKISIISLLNYDNYSVIFLMSSKPDLSLWHIEPENTQKHTHIICIKFWTIRTTSVQFLKKFCMLVFACFCAFVVCLSALIYTLRVISLLLQFCTYCQNFGNSV